jgi:hypothetical protein
MAVTSLRRLILQLTGDVTSEIIRESENAASPGDVDLVTLSSGANTITPPANAQAVMIIPPDNNTIVITLKGIAGDTGVELHKTQTSVIALNNAATTFVLNAAAQIQGVRLCWA